MTLLEECFERPKAKAVVSSQWVRMHELIVRRLEKKRWDYALFHGGISGAKRGALVEQFHKDPKCRVFLSTDAGGVGLNLQHAASIVVNMHLPWNPAFLEKSLFAGVLDGGESEVFLGGSRLARFMEGVTAVTISPAQSGGEPATPQEPEPTVVSSPPPAAAGPVSAVVSQRAEAAANPWMPLLSAGLKAVEALAAAVPAGNGDGKGAEKAATTGPWIETDARAAARS